MTIRKALFRAGVLLLSGSLLIICLILLHHVLSLKAVASQPLSAGGGMRSDWVQLPAGRFRLGVELTARTQSFAPQLRPGGGGDLVPLFRFPLDYRIVDRSGKALFEQRVWIDSIGDLAVASHRPYQGLAQTREVEVAFDAFSNESPIPVRIEARLHRDLSFGAEVDAARIELRPIVALPLVVGPGLLAALAGLLLMFLALAWEVVAALNGGVAAPRRRRFFEPVRSGRSVNA